MGRIGQMGFRAFVLGWHGFALILGAEDWKLGEAVYRDVRIHEQTPAMVTIFHRDGISQLAIGDLPEGLRERLDYDPEEAVDWLARERRAAERERLVRERERRAVREQAATPVDADEKPVSRTVFHDQVDLRPVYRELGLYPKNQGRRPSCSAFAVVGALEFARAAGSGETDPLSEEFLIWAIRELYPEIDIDSGFNFGEVMSALQVYGVPPHDLMPNTVGKKVEEIEPPPEALEAARALGKVVPVWFRPNEPSIIEDLVSILNDGNPIILGVRWPHWRTLRDTNLLSEQKPVPGGAHAVTLVGYRNTGGTPEGTTFIFRNSYGYDWGLAGFGFMKATYLKEHIIAALYLKAGE
jgi:hypothetical protein